MAMLSFRLLLVLALYCSGHGLFAQCSKTEVYDAIVVGAGISGLSAAATLRSSGMEKVLILEAADRIGGRVWTIDPWGSKLELGASWIHGIENSPLFNVVQDLNLTVQPTIYNNACLTCKMNSMALYDCKGERLSAEEVETLKKLAEKFETHLDEINAHGRNHTLNYLDALNSFSKKMNLSQEMYDRFYFILRLLNTYEVAIDLQNMSVSIEEVYKETQVSGTNAIVPLGYNLVAATLAKNLAIQLNCKVDKISYGNEIVECSTEKGVFRSKRCIVTVPLGALKANTISFLPPLPKEKQSVIDKIVVGVFNKIYLFFPCTFWDRDEEWIEMIPPPESRDEIYDIMNFGKYFKQPILLAFTAGRFAEEVERWSDKKTIDSVMSALKRIYGDDIPSPSSYVITRWKKNPLFYGSYSTPGLQTDEKSISTLAKPVMGRLFFAGEATSPTDCSTVLGAYTSGQRAAKQLLKETSQ